MILKVGMINRQYANDEHVRDVELRCCFFSDMDTPSKRKGTESRKSQRKETSLNGRFGGQQRELPGAE